MSVTTHQLGERFAPHAAALLTGPAPYVAFLDDLVETSSEAFFGLFELLLASSECFGATLGAKALTAVYGDFPKEGSADPNVVMLTSLPPWFSIMRRNVIDARACRTDWATPEFLLLDIAAHAPPGALFIRVGDEHSIRLEARTWVSDVLDASALLLAEDLTRFRTANPSALHLVPPQFQIEAIGQKTDAPGLPAAANERGSFPRFSVICPVYKPQFLVETIESVKAQTWQNWELILRVDGPPEPALSAIKEIVVQYANDPRIQCAFQGNMGTGPTRNVLSMAATGDFILSMDDDDTLAPEALETFASAVLHNPGIPFFRGGAQLTGLVTRDVLPRPRLVINGISNDIFEVTQPFLIAREALRAIGGFEWDEGLRNAGEDTILFQKLDKLRLETRLIDRVLYYRRLSTCNLTLEFNRDECGKHSQTLDDLTHPPEWQLLDCKEDLIDEWLHSSSAYRGPDGRLVIGSTRFFQYRTFGPISDTTIDLELTSVCNAVCTFCPREVMPDKTKFLSVRVAEQLADQLAKLKKKKPEVVFCGIGESTLHPQLEQITRLIAGSGAFVSMTSNGARMTVELFHKLVRAGMYGFNFSLNAASPETYHRVMKLKGLEKITSTIDSLLEIRKLHYPWVAIHVSFVVCQQNEHEVHHFVQQWRDRGVTQVWLHPINNRAGLLSESARPVSLERFADDYAGDHIVVVDVLRHQTAEEDLCKVAKSFNFISADGRVRLCAMDYRRQTDYGDLFTSDLQHAHYKKLRAFLAGETKSICDGCDFNPKRAQTTNGSSGRVEVPLAIETTVGGR